MSSEGPYGRQGFNANAGYGGGGGGGAASYAQPQYGYSAGSQSYGAGAEYSTYGASPSPDYQVGSMGVRFTVFVVMWFGGVIRSPVGDTHTNTYASCQTLLATTNCFSLSPWHPSHHAGTQNRRDERKGG